MATTRRHPLLVQAGIEDVTLAMEFEDRGMIAAPSLTYQYNKDGGLDTSHFVDWTPLCEDAPVVFRDRFVSEWHITGRVNGLPDLDGMACWERLRELVGEMLERFPDSPNVQLEAWLVGLIPEMPPEWRPRLDQLHQRIADYHAERRREIDIVEKARISGERQIVRSWMTTDCCNGSRDCSFDRATEYVLPDGTYETKYVCCH